MEHLIEAHGNTLRVTNLWIHLDLSNTWQHLSSFTLSHRLQLCGGRCSLYALQLTVPQVLRRPHQKLPQIVLADGPDGIQICR
jgi:hypothetical protein